MVNWHKYWKLQSAGKCPFTTCVKTNVKAQIKSITMSVLSLQRKRAACPAMWATRLSVPCWAWCWIWRGTTSQSETRSLRKNSTRCTRLTPPASPWAQCWKTQTAASACTARERLRSSWESKRTDVGCRTGAARSSVTDTWLDGV